MGNPEADSSNYQQDQADCNVQIQYNVQVSYDDNSNSNSNSNNPAYYNPNPQPDQLYLPLQSGGNNDGPNLQYQQNDAANDPQQQQQQQQQFQPPQQQQQFGLAQNAPPPPQFNQAYATVPPPQPVAQFPPQSPQLNPAYENQGAYPPQQQPSYPPMAAAPQQYPPQQQPQSAAQPVQFPPPKAYPPNLPPPKPYPPPQAYQQQSAAQPVQFPPPAGGGVQYAAVPPSPIKPGVQGHNGTAQGIPMQANMMGNVNTEGWTTGLFDCMDDPLNAVITCLFPCLTFGQVAELIDNGTTTCATAGMMYALIGCFIGLPCIYSCTFRSKLRSKFGLVESPAPDWIVHFLCEPCALCQEYRELNRRGWDPAIGWVGNVQRQQQMQQQQVAMMPPMSQTMMA
ncbi:protein PLANT CADMIUM RESISTANCE 6-like [Eucalyptus grandis]|uniref:protein PLANT CADMIUM RESISTANCE 6-like n=1 Tax=Eucalyptus grandis TaxID=71139 RepID=UPI00192E7E58|nr:protein PLANT CADMIUM RESISTANCE 6-like [Eucalyptus grandis]